MGQEPMRVDLVGCAPLEVEIATAVLTASQKMPYGNYIDLK
jgi:hypothetical protein